MFLLEIDKNEYEKLVDKNEIVFCLADFLELNKYKVERVRYFAGANGNKTYFAMAVGEKDKSWRIPFSAPFGIPVLCRKEPSLSSFFDFSELMKNAAAENGIEYFEIFLPPFIYGEEYIQKFLSAFLNCGFKIKYQDLNYGLNVNRLSKLPYQAYLDSKARNKLSISLKAELELVVCDTDEMKKSAYEIIRINRESKGYPLRMTLEQVLDTINIVKNDFFIVKKNGNGIAAAMIYYVTDKIAQVIYWGDIPDVGQYKPMNFLAYELTRYYSGKGIQYLDIGPSTENGIPNFGLCDFKESIGCEISSKFKIYYGGTD